MAGTWGDPTSGGGAPGQTGQIDPQTLKRYQLMMQLMSQRGPAGMPPGSQMFAGQQGGLLGMLVQNPELLKYFMGQNQQGMGQFPRDGGGVNLLAQLLGAPQQQTGQPT